MRCTETASEVNILREGAVISEMCGSVSLSDLKSSSFPMREVVVFSQICEVQRDGESFRCAVVASLSVIVHQWGSLAVPPAYAHILTLAHNLSL